MQTCVLITQSVFIVQLPFVMHDLFDLCMCMYHQHTPSVLHNDVIQELFHKDIRRLLASLSE